MEKALIQEWEWRAPEIQEGATSVYFGGGTPSLFPLDGLERVLAAIRSRTTHWDEVTLEANPEDITAERVEAWRAMGITRLSIGVQTFDDNLLRWMNRAHTGNDAERALECALNAGFEHVSADLIYGLPGRKLDGWSSDLSRMLAHPIDHLSAYILTIEPRTVLGHRVANGEQEVPADKQVIEAYRQLCERAKKSGFEHYEVSNFARKGGHAIHNRRYWSGAPYIGLGPGAHGFQGATRYANVANNPTYMAAVHKAASARELPSTIERLTTVDRYNEALMTGLRTQEGINPDDLFDTYGIRPDTDEVRAWSAALQEGELKSTPQNSFHIPEASWLLVDAISARFFRVD